MKERVMKKIVLGIICFCCLWLWLPIKAGAAEFADELIEGYDFSETDSVVEEILPQQFPDFQEMVTKAMQGQLWLSPVDFVKIAVTAVKNEITARKNLFAAILMCGILSALCKNIASLCENRQIADLGFYFIYLLLSVFLLQAFEDAAGIVKEGLDSLIAFLNVALPAYYLSVGVSVGGSTANGFYQLSMLAIYAVQYVLIYFLLPVSCVYMFFSVLSGISKDDRLDGILKLLHKLNTYVITACMAFIGGLGAVQSLLSPVADGISYGTAKRIISAIPGIGQVTDATLQMVAGSLLLLKNGIGAAILVVLIVLCLVPLFRVLVIGVIMKVAGAFIGMITDFRIVKCTERVGSAGIMLFKIMAAGFSLNFLMIAMMAACKNPF